MIKRIARTAGFTGLLAALLLTLLQSFWVAPLILQAETYEKPAASEVHEHADMAMPAHEHDAEAWEPEDGWQRVLSTTGGNLVGAVGFALYLNDLARLQPPAAGPDCDVLIEYTPDASLAALTAAVEGFAAQGLRVRAEGAGSGLAAARRYCFDDKGLREEPEC